MGYFRMFTEEGEKAVKKAIKQVCTDARLPTLDDYEANGFWVLYEEICNIVKEKGKNQINKVENYNEYYGEEDEGEEVDYNDSSKYIKGFNEVTDTEVRESVYLHIKELIEAKYPESD
jgi:hypothetical protein